MEAALTAIQNLKMTRRLTLKMVDGISDDRLLTIPERFSNNLLWQLGHLVVTQQLICYKLAGLPIAVSDEWVSGLRKATSPADWTTPPDIARVKELLISLPDQLEQDYQAGIFKSYTRYETSTGVVLSSIDEAILFNTYHEGIHLGAIMALRKLV